MDRAIGPPPFAICQPANSQSSRAMSMLMLFDWSLERFVVSPQLGEISNTVIYFFSACIGSEKGQAVDEGRRRSRPFPWTMEIREPHTQNVFFWLCPCGATSSHPSLFGRYSKRASCCTVRLYGCTALALRGPHHF